MGKEIVGIIDRIDGIVICPSICESFIASEYGIKCKVELINGRPAIKIYNHLSLFSMINKIRKNFDFEVYHQHQKNEYIILIGKKY